MRSLAILTCLSLSSFLVACGDDTPNNNKPAVCTGSATRPCACPWDTGGATSGTATCASDGSAWGACVCPTCNTHEYTACDTDGNVYFYDSCDVREELSVTCPTNSTCVEATATTAGCECDGNWTGVNCDGCPENFTGAACDTCANEWTNAECSYCPPHFNQPNNCSGCANEWTGDACGICPPNFDEPNDCSGCSAHWTGTDCTACANRYYGVNCDQCPDNFTLASNCAACANRWTGDDCNVCPDYFTSGSNCASCKGMRQGTDCEICPQHAVQDAACNLCQSGWFGANCNACRFFVATDGNDANQGVGWTVPKQSLQGAIDAASALVTAGADYCEVWVKAGTYYSYSSSVEDAFLLAADVHVFGGFAGTEGSVAERNIAANPTILSGNPSSGLYSRNVVKADGSSGGAVLDGFTITGGGRAVAPVTGECDKTECWGGGLIIRGADEGVAVENCTFAANRTWWDGGAVHVAIGTATFTSCTFTGNSARERAGAVSILDSNVTFTDCEFASNTVGTMAAPFNPAPNNGTGGALYVQGHMSFHSHVELDNCTFTSNEAKFQNASGNHGWGGAIHVADYSALEITDGTFVTNRSSFFGGAIALTGANSSLTLHDVAFDNNQAYNNDGTLIYHDGGAIYAGAGALTIDGDTTFYLDYASRGAGIALMGTSVLDMTGGRFSYNHATDVAGGAGDDPAGGAVYIDTLASASFTNTVFMANTAGRDVGASAFGGAISTFGALEVVGGHFLLNGIWGPLSWGGAIYVGDPTGTASVTNAVMDSNFSAAMGGAIFLDEDTSAVVQGVRMTNNASYFGGAVAVRSADLTLERSILAGNKGGGTGSLGGAIYLNNVSWGSGTTGDPAVDVSNSVIAGNWADSASSLGGGIYIADGVATLANTTVYANALPLHATYGANVYVNQYAHLDANDNVMAAPASGNNISAHTLNTTPHTMTYNVTEYTYSCTGCVGNIDAYPLDFAAAPTPATGTWTGKTYIWGEASVLSYATGGWTAGALVGHFVQVDTTQPRILPIIANTADSVTVPGDIASGTAFKIINLHPQVGTTIAEDFIDKGGPDQLATDITGQAAICVTGRPANTNGCRDIGAYEYLQ